MTDLIDMGPYDRIDLAAWRWPNFRPFELRHRHDDRVYVVADFIDKVQNLRARVGFGLEVSSYYRSPDYNAKVSETGSDGPHTSGRAIDLLVSGVCAHSVLKVALDIGFTGIGVKQKGTHGSRFIHLDDLDTGSRPWVWSY